MRRLPTAAAAVAAAILMAGCGGGGNGEPADVETEPVAATTDDGPAFSGGKVSPLIPAPELGLRNWDGTPVRMSDYRGKAVLVTFLYTRCPDICPLTIDNLVRVKTRLGPKGRRLAIVVVSVDPKGDTPANVRRFLVNHRALGRADYLIGGPRALEAAWARWGIAAQESKDNPALIEHSGVIWGVDTRGRRATFYPVSGFDVADIEGDIRLMLDG